MVSQRHIEEIDANVACKHIIHKLLTLTEEFAGVRKVLRRGATCTMEGDGQKSLAEEIRAWL